LYADGRYERISRNTIQFKNIRSVLAVPLKAEDQLVGLIYIDHSREAAFDESDLDLLNAFASQAALSIYRTRQHQRQIKELTLLNELSRSIVQVLDLDEVLTRIVDEATRMLNVETGSVLLLERNKSEMLFSISVSKGKRVDIPIRLRIGQGLAGWAVSEGQPIFVNDVSQDPRWFGEVEEGFETNSILCVPLKLKGRVLGALQVLNKKGPYGFGSSDVALLSAFAASATIAIENARLFQEARQVRQLRILHEAALALSSTFDLNRILGIGLEKSLTALRAEAGAISLINAPTLSYPSSAKANQSLFKTLNLTAQQTELLTQFAKLVHQHPINQVMIIDRVHPSDDFPDGVELLNHLGIEVLALTLIKGQEINGLLAIINIEPQIYNAEEINLLESMTHIIGLAVQNAVHYNQVRAQALQLSYLNEIGTALTRSLDIAHVLKVIIEGVNALLATEHVFVFLVDAETNELVLRYGNEFKVQDPLGFETPKGLPWLEIADWVLVNNYPVLISDGVSDPPELRPLVDRIGTPAISILGVPLRIEDQVIGVVETVNIGGGQVNHQDQALLIELTRWAAIALENARLYDERVRAYQHLAAEQQRRIAAETRGAMATIILDMAHTMNNILGAIRVWVGKLESAALTKPHMSVGQFKKEVNQIRQNTQEAIKLIGNMTGPLEVPEITPTDVHICLVKAIQSCWWPEHIRLHTDYALSLPLVKANAKRLETVFHNLLANATQAIGTQNGDVYVQTRQTANGLVEIIFTDNGPGVSPKILNSIFEPGVSSKEGGLGIGLWLVQTFIRQFGGQIQLTSSEAGRTIFVIMLQRS